jgi:hypothetical protein
MMPSRPVPPPSPADAREVSITALCNALTKLITIATSYLEQKIEAEEKKMR